MLCLQLLLSSLILPAIGISITAENVKREETGTEMPCAQGNFIASTNPPHPLSNKAVYDNEGCASMCDHDRACESWAMANRVMVPTVAGSMTFNHVPCLLFGVPAAKLPIKFASVGHYTFCNNTEVTKAKARSKSKSKAKRQSNERRADDDVYVNSRDVAVELQRRDAAGLWTGYWTWIWTGGTHWVSHWTWIWDQNDNFGVTS